MKNNYEYSPINEDMKANIKDKIRRNKLWFFLEEEPYMPTKKFVFKCEKEDGDLVDYNRFFKDSNPNPQDVENILIETQVLQLDGLF